MPSWSVRLTEARATFDLSQAEVAHRLRALSREIDGVEAGVDRRMVRRWEHGTMPSARYRRLLCTLYGMSSEQLGFSDEPSPTPAPTRVLDVPFLGAGVWTPSDMAPLLELAGAGERAAPLSSECVARLVHEWLVVDPPQIVEQRAGRRIGERLVGHVERRVAQLRFVDDFVGGRDLYELVARELHATIELLDTAAYTEALGRRLLVAVGELCQLAGWVAADAGLPHAAERYYVAGVRAAHAAGERPLAAHAVSSLAYQIANGGDRQTAVLLARSAHEGARAQASATTQALLLERVAWAHARAGEVTQTERALDAVDCAFDRRDPSDDPSWVYWLDADEIAVMAGRCYTELRQSAKAEPLLRRALERYGDSRAREAALYWSWLAETHIHAGDIDHAASAAMRTLELAARINSVRGDERVAHLHQALATHRKVAAVRDFDERYRSLASNANADVYG